MCLSTEPAHFSNTLIYSAEVEHADHTIRHVIGYQNHARSYSNRPNAMLLPFPAEGKVGRENLVNGEKFSGILTAYDQAIERLKPRARSLSKGFSDDDTLLGAAVASYEVFESGSYTIALADSPAGIGAALKEVPESVRPEISTRFLTALSALYPKWSFALCCFRGDIEAEPLFWHYKPRFREALFAPAVDAHDGNPPNLTAMVDRNHTVAFASYATDRAEDQYLREYIEYNVPQAHRWLFNARVCGSQIGGRTRNGDFVHPVSEIRSRKTSSLLNVKVAPPPKDGATTWDFLMKDPLGP